jgi:7,8-dihydropterin-6-yl-methyl-4-(beta-D-ribofuranosyl)aminobenzene 5'-phosphate synthase
VFRFTVIYDNAASQGFTGSWGFAALVETNSEILLFDTGWDGILLLKHMRKLNIDPANIKKLILSHQHWDHIGGLPEILQANPGIKVYAPASFSENLKKEIGMRASLVEIKGPVEISQGIKSTGELGDKIKEQALILDTGKGCYILTGCAHPGLASILDTAFAYGNVKGILGDCMIVRNLKDLEGWKP